MSELYYNISFDPKTGGTNLITTYSQIFESFQNQLLNDVMIGYVAFLLLCIAVIEITRNMNPATITEIMNHTATKEGTQIKILRSIAWVCFPIALFGTLIMISIKYNLNW